ncbi:HAD family hydrolase [Hyphococcus sp.]|uniref:HAD family hydrolase n=1 Tax=Hyphococcus sp. TaxID=2038636 RepID=UPI003D10F160
MQTLLFDLGGVVVDYRGPERLAALTKGRMSLDDAHEALSSSENLHAFERGEISPEDFASAVVTEWRLDVTPEFFIADFETWPERFLPGAAELIKGLAGQYRLACLSNINILHWRRCEALDLPRLFETHFLSHEMGARKPEPKIYLEVIEGLGVQPGDIIFFDDSTANIRAAQKNGLKAFHVSHDEGIAAAIMRAGLL